jgi:hypothetical protein
MTTYADLEIALRRRDGAAYAVDFRFILPGSKVEPRLRSAEVSFDLQQLRALSLDVPSYAKLLSSSLFRDTALKTAFSTARATAHTEDASLRVRLLIDGAPELHCLRWEMLQDPDDGSYLFTGEQILFSRYLSSLDWRKVALRWQSQLTALIVIANPANLNKFQLAPVDVAGELARAQSSMNSIRTTELASAGKATINNLEASLREGGHDILYLVCHGKIVEDESQLFIEDDDGKGAWVAGSELASRLNGLSRRPKLVVLASCQSAGNSEGSVANAGVLVALGSLLADAGIPAVLAMQGNVSMETLSKFMPVFFRELLRDGQIDRAVAVARGDVRDRPDCWMPVLFMRLVDGRIWYVPGFADDQEGFERWPALLNSIRQGRCTPILGSGLTESLIGSSREIAQRWAEKCHFPMAPSDREDLPNVAQYRAIDQDSQLARSELSDYLSNQIRDRYPSAPPDAALDQLLEYVGSQRRKDDPAEPHRVLARLSFPIYITTNPDTLLESALLEEGKHPQSEICRWNGDLEALPSIYDKRRGDKGPAYRADPNRPLVYHLFGRLSVPESLVLTEDDYFDYLIGVTRNEDLIPEQIKGALVNTALLFLGFQMDDWDFRVLFRSLMGQEGGKRRIRYSHVAVQIDPEQGRVLEPEGARRYLDKYFAGAHISIYWGNAEDFVKELNDRRLAAAAGA